MRYVTNHKILLKNFPFKRLKGKGETIPVIGHGGPYVCEMLNIPHFSDNQLIDGCEVVSLMCRLPFTPRKIPGTHLLRG
jgi:hypothetical protein